MSRPAPPRHGRHVPAESGPCREATLCASVLPAQAEAKRARRQRRDRGVIGPRPGRSSYRPLTRKNGNMSLRARWRLAPWPFCGSFRATLRGASGEPSGAAAGVPSKRPTDSAAAIGTTPGRGSTGRGNSARKGCCSALAIVKLVPGATSGRTNIGLVRLSALTAAACAGPCGCGELKYHPVAMRSGGASSTQLLTAS
jgi:hypothetical protein